MKIDKDALLKQRFWIVLVVLVLLVPVAVILLWLSVGSAVATQEKNIKDTKDKLQALPNPPENEKFEAALAERIKQGTRKKDEIWGQAWKGQESFMTWPGDLAESLNGKAFGDDISFEQANHYANDLYLPQVWGIANIIEPEDAWTTDNAVTSTRTAAPLVVQYQGGPDAVLTYVRDRPWKSLPPTAEDVWLAQEDLWYQKGLLLAVRQANDSVAGLGRLQGGQAKVPSFANSGWRLDIDLGKIPGKVAARLTNVGSRKQELGIRFRVTFADQTPPVVLYADGEPLAPGQSFDVTPAVVRGIPSDVASVVQVGDWRTVAVKMVERLALDYPSSRTSYVSLAPDTIGFPPADTTGTAGTGGTSPFGGAPAAGGMGGAGSGGGGSGGGGGAPMAAAGGGGSGGGGSGAGGGGFPGAGGGAGGAGASGPSPTTANGLSRNRYVEITQAVRRRPFGMVVIVEQNHVADFLTSIANSSLRIQTTQIGWQHYRGSIKPPAEEDTSDTGTGAPGAGGAGTGAAAPRPGGGGSAAGGGAPPRPAMGTGMGGTGAAGRPAMGGTGMGGTGRPAMGGTGAAGRPAMGGGAPGTGGATTAGPDEPNAGLVELAVYGIATFYRKYPPNPPKTPAGGAGGAPGLPGGPAAGGPAGLGGAAPGPLGAPGASGAGSGH